MPTSGDYRLQAARIEAVLASQKVAARVWQATVSHRFVRFDLTIQLGVKIGKVEDLEDEIAFALGANAVSVYRAGGVLRVEVPLERPADYTLPYAFGLVKGYPPYTALLGERTDGTPLLVALNSPDITHILIAGTTGSGKTVLLVDLLLTLAMTNHAGVLQFVLIDPKGVKLAPIAAFPHRWRGLGVISDPAEAALALKALVAENNRRKGRVVASRIVVAIDELADVIQYGGPTVVESLQSLTQSGREQGLHVIAATQRPAAALVGGMVKANFPTRLLGKVASTEDAKVAAGIGATGAERLAGRGDFKLLAAGELLRFQSAFVTKGEIEAIAGAVWANHRRSRGWTQFELEQAIARPIALPAEAETFVGVGEAVTGLVTVTGDSGASDAKTLPPAFFRLTPGVSPVTVTTPHPVDGSLPPSTGLTPEQQLDALLPIGTYLRMVEPDAETRALLRLAYHVKRTTNATLLRVYGRDQQGRIRKNTRNLAWLKAAIDEAAPSPASLSEESETEATE